MSCQSGGRRRAAGARRSGSRVCWPSTSETGERIEVAGASVVNATGVWADQLRPEELHGEAELPRDPPQPRDARDLLAATTCRLSAGAIVPAGGGHGRSSRCRGSGRTLVGTTDNDYEGPLDHVPPGARMDIDYLLEATNQLLRRRQLGPGDLDRRLRRRASADLDRRHRRSRWTSRARPSCTRPRAGMITITGGKLTTWRRMAKMTVDRLVERDGARGAMPHAGDSARAADRRPMSLPRVRGGARRRPTQQLASALRPRRACRSSRSRRAIAGSSPAPIVAGLPDLLAEVVLAARAASRRAAWATCSCAVRAWDLLAAPRADGSTWA